MMENREMENFQKDPGNIFPKGTSNLFFKGLGALVVILGLKFSYDIFYIIKEVFFSPEKHQKTFEYWLNFFGGKDLTIHFQEKCYPVANYLSIIIMFLGCLLLAWFSLTLMTTGASVISKIMEHESPNKFSKKN